MGVISKIEGIEGDQLEIEKGGTLVNSDSNRPPLMGMVEPLPYISFFEDENGSSNMVVNASLASPQSFRINASTEFDIYIKSITIQISDPGARLNEFGNLTALTNGVRFYYFTPETGEVEINSGIQRNLDFFRDATGGKGFGEGQTAFLADIAGGGGEDTYLPEFDLCERFGYRWGLKLPKGSTSYIAYDVRDNLTGINIYNSKAYGLRI